MESKLGTLVSLTGLKLGNPWKWMGWMQGTPESSRESKLDNP